MGGRPFTLVGRQLKVGDQAPNFRLLTRDLKEVELSQTAGKVRLIASVHSLDTSICDLEARRFNAEAAGLPGMVVYVVSMDLPFAQARYCGAQNIQNLQTLSDHREASFGRAYGVLIKELRLLARALFIVDGAGLIRYVDYLPEVGQHPDYEKALQALRSLAGTAQA